MSADNVLTKKVQIGWEMRLTMDDGTVLYVGAERSLSPDETRELIAHLQVYIDASERRRKLALERIKERSSDE